MSRLSIAGLRSAINWLQNLFTYSQQADNAAWVKGSSSISANATIAPDGTLTADGLVDSVVNTNHYISQNVVVNVGKFATVSGYFKAGSKNFVWVQLGDEGFTAYFNLATGTVGSITSPGVYYPSTRMIDAGNGWYRCIVTFLPGFTPSRVFIGSAPTDGGIVYAGAGDTALYLWGMQFVRSNYEGVYTQTTTPAVTTELRNKNPIGQNLFLQSNAFTTTWINSSNELVLTPNAVANPLYGTVNAWKIADIVDGGVTTHRVAQIVTSGLNAGKVYTFAAYAKAIKAANCWIMLAANSGYNLASYNLNTGALGQFIGHAIGLPFDHGMTSLGNGWYRMWQSFYYDGNNTLSIYTATGDGAGYVYQGIGEDFFYLYGAQFTEGSGLTQYYETTTLPYNIGGARLVHPTRVAV